MDTQQPVEGTEPVWGAPPPAAPAGAPQPKRWSAGKTAAVVAVAAVVAAGGGYGISKLAGSSASAATQGGPGGGFGAGGGGGFGGRGGGAGGIGGLLSALHGDFTVSDNGSYVTERMQTGEITAVSTTSITAKSADGYTQTYVINSSTQVDEGDEKVSDLKTGATVTIIAKLSGSTGTATTISDQQFGPGNGGQQGQQGQQQGQPPQGN